MFVRRFSRALFARFGAAAPLVMVASAPAGASDKSHDITIQVSENDKTIMNLALNNIVNISQFYSAVGDLWKIELVAYGPGLHIFRADTSPVKERLHSIKTSIPDVTFSACQNTLEGMEKAEGHPIQIVPEARIVPAGVVRLVDLQERHYSYIKP